MLNVHPIGVGVLDDRHPVAHHVLGHLAENLLHFRGQGQPYLVDLTQTRFHFRGHGLHARFHFFTLFRRELFEHLAAHGFPIVQRNGLNSGRGFLEGQSAFRGRLFQLLKNSAFLFLKSLLDRVFLFLEGLIFKGFGQAAFEVVDESLDLLAELHGFAAGHLHGHRTVLVLEVVDHAPVRRSGQSAGVLADNILNNGGFAGSLDAGHKNIVARAGHVQTEIDGLDSALLADDMVQRFQVGGTGKGEKVGIAHRAKFVGGEFLRFGHGPYPFLV